MLMNPVAAIDFDLVVFPGMDHELEGAERDRQSVNVFRMLLKARDNGLKENVIRNAPKKIERFRSVRFDQCKGEIFLRLTGVVALGSRNSVGVSRFENSFGEMLHRFLLSCS